MPQLVSAKTSLPPAERNTLVARSHDAYRNHMIARAAVTRNKTNIVGTGLIAHPCVDAKVLGISEDEAESLNQLFASRWRWWAENPLECDIEASLDFYGLQVVALVSSLLSGDVFALSPNVLSPRGMFELKVQFVDGARISNPNGAPNTETLCDGIEMDAYGKPIRYHIRRKHPADKSAIVDGWDKVEVFGAETGRRRAMHIIADRDQVGIVRGAPYLAPILEPLQSLETYGRHELIAAVVSAMFTVFLEKESSAFGDPGASAFDGQTTETDGSSSSLSLGNGAIVDLAPGEKATFANPSRPNTNYDPFYLSIVKQIGAALELPIDELLLHYSSSYSAARAAMLQAWRMYTQRRWMLVQQFCTPFYQLRFDEDVARGLIPVSNYADPVRRAAYTQVMWVGPARGSMDELKEAKAAETRINIGISNETIETAAMMGEDWTSVYATRLREVKRRKADGTYQENKPAQQVVPQDDPAGDPSKPQPDDDPA